MGLLTKNNSQTRPSKPHAKGSKKPKFKHVVCKPCWELKYCPYGPLVEFFPLIHNEEPIPISQVNRSYKSWMAAIKHGDLQKDSDVFEAVEKVLC